MRIKSMKEREKGQVLCHVVHSPSWSVVSLRSLDVHLKYPPHLLVLRTCFSFDSLRDTVRLKTRRSGAAVSGSTEK